MKEYYLSILRLESDATVSDIKSAYRKLSKQYHPDINPSIQASEKFIQINEAYEYLTKAPKYEVPVIDYNDELSEREKWKREHLRKTKEKERENQRKQQELIKRIIWYFKPIATTILILNALLALDFMLPLQNHEQKILGISKVYEARYRSGGRFPEYRYDEMYFENFKMRFDRGEVIQLDHYERAFVEATMIFSKPLYATITVDGIDERHKQIYNIYYYFGYLIPVMIALGVLYLKLQKPMHKFNIGIILLFFSCVQLIMWFV